jgi:hypothetical protein
VPPGLVFALQLNTGTAIPANDAVAYGGRSVWPPKIGDVAELRRQSAI